MRHGAQSIHWCMDLYPEIAVALGEIKAGNLSRIVGSVMGWSYRRTSTTVVLDSDMATRLREHGVKSQIIRPWVMNWLRPAPGIEPTVDWTWLYSGNLGRAHEWQTLLEAQAILENENRDIRLVFQGGGPSWNAAQSHANSLGLKQVEWRPYASESEVQSSLLRARCLAVTQRVEVQGMLWPSKLALMLALPRPILFVGPPDGDIGRSLRAMTHAGVFAPGDARGVAAWLTQMKERGLAAIIGDVVDAETHREESLAKWVEIIESCGPKAKPVFGEPSSARDLQRAKDDLTPPLKGSCRRIVV
jgi:hypothetical protein